MPEVLTNLETEQISPTLLRRIILLELLTFDYHFTVPLEEDKKQNQKIREAGNIIWRLEDNNPVRQFVNCMLDMFFIRVEFREHDNLSPDPEENNLNINFHQLFLDFINECEDLISFIGGPVSNDEEDCLDLDQLNVELEEYIFNKR
jgi:hypothetical protein